MKIGLTTGLLVLATAAGAPLQAARFTFTASNPGAISGTGRDLVFDIQGVDSEIRAARIEFTLNYDRAGELSLRLVEVADAVELPLLPGGGLSGASFAGTYSLSDRAPTTITQLGAAAGPIPRLPMRAFQFGATGGQCLNLIARFLEFDRGRNGPLTLAIQRTAGVGGGGSGSISNARLIIDTAEPEELFASGFEGPAEGIVQCRRPPLDLVFNGGVESARSPLSVLDFTTHTTPVMTWATRQLLPFMLFGPVELGFADTPTYAGRFGGRSRLNFGFWDPASGALNFTTGAGGRSLELPGDWLTTEHYPIPGDYDGDGVTDLAMAFRDQDNLWLARIRFSRTDVLNDQIIDPRVIFPASFSSPRIGFGAQDSDGDGRDEIVAYARVADAGPQMRMAQIVPATPASTFAAFDGPSWGIFGDQLVRGRWSTSPSGNQLGLMVVRANTASNQYEWYRFPDPTPVIWGLPNSDVPVSIDIDGDGQNDIAVYRRSDQTWYFIQSSNGVNGSFGYGTSTAVPLGTLQGLISPPQF